MLSAPFTTYTKPSELDSLHYLSLPRFLILCRSDSAGLVGYWKLQVAKSNT